MTEAAKLQKKTISKGKLKKSIKNVLCRPDPVFWPAISTEDSSKLEITLNKYKINLPEYKKPHWNEIKAIPKEKRPKPPNLPKVEGLLFGISECLNAVTKLQCSAIIIEATVNPRTIVQPILEKCYSNEIPVLCMSNLRKNCAKDFGIPTSCLGIKDNSLHDLHSEILGIAKSLNYPKVLNKEKEMKMDTEITQNKTEEHISIQHQNTEYLYLYRSTKKTRVFVPSKGTTVRTVKDFTGHNFISLPHKEDHKQNSNKKHMKMLLKKILNNPNREKRKQNISNEKMYS